MCTELSPCTENSLSLVFLVRKGPLIRAKKFSRVSILSHLVDVLDIFSFFGETDFYTPPVLGGAALLPFSAPAVYKKSCALGTLIFIHRWRWKRQKGSTSQHWRCIKIRLPFFLLGEGEGRVRGTGAEGGGGGSIFYWKSQEGGGVSRMEGPRGREGVCGVTLELWKEAKKHSRHQKARKFWNATMQSEHGPAPPKPLYS